MPEQDSRTTALAGPLHGAPLNGITDRDVLPNQSAHLLCRTTAFNLFGIDRWVRSGPAVGAGRPVGYRVRRRAPDPTPAATFPHRGIDSQIPELVTLASTVDACGPRSTPSYRPGITNART